MGLEAGKMLGHCRLVEKIGEGGMGVVWKAVDTTLDREAEGAQSPFYYLEAESLMEVEIKAAAMTLGKPRKLFDSAYSSVEELGLSEYDVTPDGDFIMVRHYDEEGIRPTIVLVQNWLAEFTSR